MRAGGVLLRAIRGAAVGRLPQADLDDRESMLGRHFENPLGDVLRRRVGVHQIDRFAQFFEHFHGGVGAIEDHAMVEILVDPTADDLLDLREVQHHAVRVEPRGVEGDDRAAVVSMQMAALARVVQQAVPVTEIDFA